MRGFAFHAILALRWPSSRCPRPPRQCVCRYCTGKRELEEEDSISDSRCRVLQIARCDRTGSSLPPEGKEFLCSALSTTNRLEILRRCFTRNPVVSAAHSQAAQIYIVRRALEEGRHGRLGQNIDSLYVALAFCGIEGPVDAHQGHRPKL
ncbi:hypothetical protein BCR34DRAFT_294953 [Clohesyomyces aquaticus]|uniref:Uncharacterized protein n=1 Tax=Clohesyomyces aquaticus TaxID=1231657 RepID=A0A1Y2A918_9PLEO|nr:hypothetical protein BCR34DRAFT_294953 [Clohesyomyces aquaticus]